MSLKKKKKDTRSKTFWSNKWLQMRPVVTLASVEPGRVNTTMWISLDTLCRVEKLVRNEEPLNWWFTKTSRARRPVQENPEDGCISGLDHVHLAQRQRRRLSARVNWNNWDHSSCFSSSSVVGTGGRITQRSSLLQPAPPTSCPTPPLRPLFITARSRPSAH